MEHEVPREQLRKTDVFIVGISSPSGGGKTAVTRRVAELLPGAVAIFFDDYDSADTVHPESFLRWLQEGADYNAWKTPKLKDDLAKLEAGQAVVSAADGTTIKPHKYVVFDNPLGYAHAETARFVDFMVFIDTPLDIAMARRLLRDVSSTSPDGSSAAIEHLKAGLTAYLDYARQAYLEMDRQVKPTCDLILDSRLPVDDLARQIIEIIKTRT